jgi:hypothetical protein
MTHGIWQLFRSTVLFKKIVVVGLSSIVCNNSVWHVLLGSVSSYQPSTDTQCSRSRPEQSCTRRHAVGVTPVPTHSVSCFGAKLTTMFSFLGAGSTFDEMFIPIMPQVAADPVVWVGAHALPTQVGFARKEAAAPGLRELLIWLSVTRGCKHTLLQYNACQSTGLAPKQ